jgi:hypothetical protein
VKVNNLHHPLLRIEKKTQYLHSLHRMLFENENKVTDVKKKNITYFSQFLIVFDDRYK